MASLTFVSMSKQFYAMFYSPQRPLSTLHPIYLRYADLSTSM